MVQALVDPRKLIYFAAVVEHGSVKRAAAALHMSQPALSNSLSRLEAEMGQLLLERSTVGVTPTFIGTKIYGHARQIRDELDQITRQLDSSRTDEPGGVRFGALPSLSVTVIPAAVARWRSLYPKYSLQITQKVQIELLHALLSHELDFIVGVTDDYGLMAGLKQRVLFREQLYVISRTGHPLLCKPDLSWSDLAHYSWVSPPAGRFSSLLEIILKAEGVTVPDATTVSSSISILKSLVGGSDSLALLPMHAVPEELRDGKLVCLPISSQMLHRNIAVFTRDSFKMQPSHVEFVKCVRSLGVESNCPRRASAAL